MGSPYSPPVAPTDPQGTFIETGRGPVHVVDEGPKGGPAFLLVHGVPGSARDFRYLGPALAARGARALRVDMPGFGHTPVASFPEVTAENRAALLVRLADRLGLDRVGVVGHSFGGSVAMMMAAAFPDRVHTLGLLASIGAIRHRSFPAFPKRVLRELARGLETPGPDLVLAELMKRSFKAIGLVADDRPAVLAFWTRLIVAIDFAHHRAALARVRCPTLVVSADDDPLVEPKIALDTAARLDDAGVPVRHLRVAEGGHQLQKTLAALIAEALVELQSIPHDHAT